MCRYLDALEDTGRIDIKRLPGLWIPVKWVRNSPVNPYGTPIDTGRRSQMISDHLTYHNGEDDTMGGISVYGSHTIKGSQLQGNNGSLPLRDLGNTLIQFAALEP